MAFDERLAERIRAALEAVPDVRERRMFGGIAFMVSGHMACGIIGDDLMVRLGRDGTESALDEPHVRPMDFTGKPSATMVFVHRDGTATARAVATWVRRAVGYVRTLPPKSRPTPTPSGG